MYFGQTLRPFKVRYTEHKAAIKHPPESKTGKERSTALSNYIWELKKAGKQYKLNWSIHTRAQPYKSGSRKCQLCLKEKTATALAAPKVLLNKRTELLGKCIHLINFELRKHKVPP